MTVGLPAAAIDLLSYLVDREADGDTGPLSWDLGEHNMRTARRYLPRLELYGLAIAWHEEYGATQVTPTGTMCVVNRPRLCAMPTATGISMIEHSRKQAAESAAAK